MHDFPTPASPIITYLNTYANDIASTLCFFKSHACLCLLVFLFPVLPPFDEDIVGASTTYSRCYSYRTSSSSPSRTHIQIQPKAHHAFSSRSYQSSSPPTHSSLNNSNHNSKPRKERKRSCYLSQELDYYGREGFRFIVVQHYGYVYQYVRFCLCSSFLFLFVRWFYVPHYCYYLWLSYQAFFPFFVLLPIVRSHTITQKKAIPDTLTPTSVL